MRLANNTIAIVDVITVRNQANNVDGSFETGMVMPRAHHLSGLRLYPANPRRLHAQIPAILRQPAQGDDSQPESVADRLALKCLTGSDALKPSAGTPTAATPRTTQSAEAAKAEAVRRAWFVGGRWVSSGWRRSSS